MYISKNQFRIISLTLILNIIIVFVFPVECSWKKLFGIECAGCGATRMVRAIIALDFYQAFRYNPLIFSLLILFIIYLIYVLLCTVFRKKFYKFSVKWGIALIVILIVFTVLRNTETFSFLKPTVVN